jgi:type II secretory pathway pseudopilin PulG
VVIAIIGILATMLFPAIKGALVKAKATKTGSDGKQFTSALIAQNLENDSTDDPAYWPIDTSRADFDEDDYPNEFKTACSSSTEYFKWAVTNGVIRSVNFSFFAAPGIPPQPDYDKFSDNNNAWCLTLDLDDDSISDDTPFMFTKNINLTGSTVDTLDEKDPLLKKRNGKKLPFGDTLGVVVTRGGAVKILTKKILFDDKNSNKRGKERFNPAGQQLKFLSPTGVGF